MYTCTVSNGLVLLKAVIIKRERQPLFVNVNQVNILLILFEKK